jgi:L-rhamnose mutarotase
MRVALHSVLREGRELDYERAHHAVPPELLERMRQVGIHDWVIWRSGRDLFHVVDCDDFESAVRTLADDPLDQRWQAVMDEFVERMVTNEGGPAGLGLHEVWRMDDADASD